MLISELIRIPIFNIKNLNLFFKELIRILIFNIQKSQLIFRVNKDTDFNTLLFYNFVFSFFPYKQQIIEIFNFIIILNS